MNAKDDMDWQERSACKNAPTGIFITPGDADDEPAYPPREALQYCNACPVKTECLNFAMRYGLVGVWGGNSTYQREQLKRKMERRSCPTCGGDDLIIENNSELCMNCGMSWYIF